MLSAAARSGADSRLHFVVYGDGALRSDVIAAAEANPNVSYRGVFDSGQTKSILATIDVLVLPSIHGEGMPMAILEAMAAGAVPYATAISSIPEVIEDGSPGFLPMGTQTIHWTDCQDSPTSKHSAIYPGMRWHLRSRISMRGSTMGACSTFIRRSYSGHELDQPRAHRDRLLQRAFRPRRLLGISGRSGVIDGRGADFNFGTGRNKVLDSDVVVRTPFRRVRHYPLDIWRFIFNVLASRPHVLLFQSWLYFPALEGVLVRLFRLFGRRAFATVHDTMPHHPQPWSRATVSFFYRGFEGLIAHSSVSAADLRNMGVTAPITVIPHATYDMFNTRNLSKKAARQELGIPDEQFVILLFGHIDERKGCFEFLEAAHLSADLDKTIFLVAGRNDLQPSSRQRLEDFRSLPNVRIDEGHVPLEAVQAYFAAVDLVATPYLEGTTSGVYRLALAFRRPVVASAVGDLNEAIARGSAFGLGRGSEIARNLADFVATHRNDLAQFAASAVAEMDKEARATSWPVIARRYVDFIRNGAGAIKS